MSEEKSTALEVIEGGDAARTAIQEWTPQFVMSVDQAVKVVEQKREYMNRVMKPEVHYGKIPGAGDKPVLLLPGAQLLSSAMALHPVFGDASTPIEDWTGKDHNGEPFLLYRRFCELRRQTGMGPNDYMIVARAEGSCSSWESKYRYRQASRVCPNCGKTGFLRKSKPPRTGFYCWQKPEKGMDGCGGQFRDDDKRITEQQVGRVANPDVLDQANTILKMADKRAYIAATLQATGCADLFTQDLEDAPNGHDVPEEETGGPSLAQAMNKPKEEPSTTTTTTPPPAPSTPKTPSSAATSPSPAATKTAETSPASSTTTTPGTATSPTTSAAATAPTATDPNVSPGAATASPSPAAATPSPASAEPEAPAFGADPKVEQLDQVKAKALELAKEATLKTNKARYPNQDWPPALVEAKAKMAITQYMKQRLATDEEHATAEQWLSLVEAIQVTLGPAA